MLIPRRSNSEEYEKSRSPNSTLRAKSIAAILPILTWKGAPGHWCKPYMRLDSLEFKRPLVTRTTKESRGGPTPPTGFESAAVNADLDFFTATASPDRRTKPTQLVALSRSRLIQATATTERKIFSAAATHLQRSTPPTICGKGRIGRNRANHCHHRPMWFAHHSRQMQTLGEIWTTCVECFRTSASSRFPRHRRARLTTGNQYRCGVGPRDRARR